VVRRRWRIGAAPARAVAPRALIGRARWPDWPCGAGVAASWRAGRSPAWPGPHPIRSREARSPPSAAAFRWLDVGVSSPCRPPGPRHRRAGADELGPVSSSFLCHHRCPSGGGHLSRQGFRRAAVVHVEQSSAHLGAISCSASPSGLAGLGCAVVEGARGLVATPVTSIRDSSPPGPDRGMFQARPRRGGGPATYDGPPAPAGP